MSNYRQDRIERLLQELEYEVSRGMLGREIDENLSFRFIVPISQAIRNGVVVCEFRTYPRAGYLLGDEDRTPRLKIVK